MVNVTPEEVIAMRKGQMALDEMTELDKDIVGRTGARIHIPPTDVYNLRRIAGLLHGLAADIDVLSRRTDMRARTIMLEMRASVADVNGRINDMTGNEKGEEPSADRQSEPVDTTRNSEAPLRQRGFVFFLAHE